MILGIGTDIVAIGRFESLIQKDSFLKKIYTPHELAHCEAKHKGKVASLAVRYAAKEAVMKALGTGYAKGVAFTDINIINDPTGKPQVALTGVTKTYAENMRVQRIHLSLSHETEYAIAYVIMED